MSGRGKELPGISEALEATEMPEEEENEDEGIFYEEMASDLMTAIKDNDAKLLAAILQTLKDM